MPDIKISPVMKIVDTSTAERSFDIRCLFKHKDNVAKTHCERCGVKYGCPKFKDPPPCPKRKFEINTVRYLDFIIKIQIDESDFNGDKIKFRVSRYIAFREFQELKYSEAKCYVIADDIEAAIRQHISEAKLWIDNYTSQDADMMKTANISKQVFK